MRVQTMHLMISVIIGILFTSQLHILALISILSPVALMSTSNLKDQVFLIVSIIVFQVAYQQYNTLIEGFAVYQRQNKSAAVRDEEVRHKKLGIIN